MVRRIILIVFACGLSLTSPAVHAASLAKNLQGTYTLTKKSSAINGVADHHPQGIPSPAPTFSVNAFGFKSVTGAKILQFMQAAGSGAPNLKLAITSSSATAFGSAASGKISFVVNNPHGPDHPVTIAISSGQIKGAIAATGLTFTGSLKGPGTIAGQTQNYTLTFTFKLTKN